MYTKKRFQCLLFLSISFALMFNACKKEKTADEPQDIAHAKGIYVLNEGMYEMNNCSLSFYNSNTRQVVADIFLSTNQRSLGDVGNDLQAYGTKLYCVVNKSETIEIMDFATGKSLKQISLAGRQPRHLAFHNGEAFISCYDGTVQRLDTATLQIVGHLQAGSNPEGLCVANHKLYVANSGGLNYPNYGTTVSVFDLNSLTLLYNLTVVCNPTLLKTAPNGNVFLLSYGNYSDIPSTLQQIDSQEDTIIKKYDEPVADFAFQGLYAYTIYYDYYSAQNAFKVLNIQTGGIEKENFITDGTVITTPYGIAIHPYTGDIYITDAGNYSVNGDVYCFDKEGKKKYQFEAGICPKNIVFKN